MTERVTIRLAVPDDSTVLSAISRAAKAQWGYSDELLDLWAEDLAVSGEFIARNYVLCAVVGDEIIGLAAVSRREAECELEHLWVRPDWMRRHVGEQLMDRVTADLRASGASELRIVADPHAEGFYLALGARRIGEVESKPEGRRLPLLVLDLG